MKNVKGSFKALALIACGVLFLSLLGGHAAAAKRPQQPQLWPEGTSLDVSGAFTKPPYPSSNYLVVVYVHWPLATGVDHYRLTVEEGRTRIVDYSPVASEGAVSYGYYVPVSPKRINLHYSITVTAYSGPDEATAYCESLEASLNLSYP
jgi:hypothetical protein